MDKKRIILMVCLAICVLYNISAIALNYNPTYPVDGWCKCTYSYPNCEYRGEQCCKAYKDGSTCKCEYRDCSEPPPGGNEK